MSAPPIAQLKDLSVGFSDHQGGWRIVLKGIDLEVRRGERIGLIGASGSGKSLTALAMIGLTPPSGRFISGRALVDGRDTSAMTRLEQRRIRGRRIGIIFQEAEAALNPVMTVGNHLKEALRTHNPELARQWRHHACTLLREVGLEPDTLDRYAHQLSGGQRQRAMIALALAPGPDLVIADEPTSSLDLLTQARILDLLADASARRGLSLLLISHDIDVVASAVDRIVVMLGGSIVEEAGTFQILEAPLHPFTRAAMSSARQAPAAHTPRHEHHDTNESGCRYVAACPVSVASCHVDEPALLDAGGSRRVRCPVVLEVDR